MKYPRSALVIGVAVLVAATSRITAKANTILPYTYATTYCELRRSGVDHPSAMRSAVRSSMISGDDWSYLSVRGTKVRSDVWETTLAVEKTCPQYSSN